MATDSLPRRSLASPAPYFIVALGWSWLCWLPAILLGKPMSSPAGLLLAMLGLLGPGISGITFTYLTRDREGRRDYWRRVVDLRRIPATGYLAILLVPPIISALAVVIDLLLGGGGSGWEEPAHRITAAPLTIVPFALGIVLVGPMEEFGWRGYVQDRLQERHGLVVASLILGVIWSLWHFPLFFFEGGYHADLGAWTPAFWRFMVGVVPLAFVFTRIFNDAKRSTLAAMMFHFTVNFTGELVELSPSAEFYSIVLWFVAAGVAIRGARPS